jgi:hypothetical protein
MNYDKSRAFSIEEFKTIGEKVLASLAENPIYLPPKTMPQFCNAVQLNAFRFSNVFGTYHYAGAYMLYYPPSAKDVTDSDSATIGKGKPLRMPPIMARLVWNAIVNVLKSRRLSTSKQPPSFPTTNERNRFLPLPHSAYYRLHFGL